MRNDIVITRGNVAQVASFIGVAGLLIGFIGLIWQGQLTSLVTGALVVGALGILLWAVMTPADFVGFITGRKVRYSTFAVLSTMLLIGVVVLVFLLLSRNTVTLDMTAARRFSLSETSFTILRRVSRPIQLTGFYSSRALPTRELDDQFFRLYETATNGMVRRVYIDPDEQPAVAQRFGVTADAQVFISYVNDDGSVDFNTLARVPRGVAQERDVTEAISRLLISGTITIYFEQSLGGRDPLDTSQEGISGIHLGVQESGLVTQALRLRLLAENGEAVPANAAAIIFARPLYDLSEAEIAVIDRYLNAGGALFLMADALFNPDAFLKADGAFNAYLWQNYGIRALDAVVVDPAASGQTALDVIGAQVFTGTDISARLEPAEYPLRFRLARAVDVNITDPIANVANGRIVMSSDASYGETNLRALSETNTYAYDMGVDIPGPMTTVVWAWNQETDARILLVGDSDFVTNGQVLTAGGNGILFTDGLAWLTRFGEQISFGFQAYTDDTPLIFVSYQTLDIIAFLTVIMLPALVLVIGVGVSMRRARRR